MKKLGWLLGLTLLSACSETKEHKEPTGDAPAPSAAAPEAAPDDKAPPSRAKAATLVGKKAPDFTLADLDGKDVSLSQFAGKTVVLEWFNPECPFVKASHGPGSLKDAAARHAQDGVVWLAINSGAAGKQGHDPAVNRDAKTKWKLAHPVLRDVDGAVGRTYGATNTPQMVVIDPNGTVVYAGAIDNSPDGEGQTPEGGTLVNYVDEALKALAAGQPVKVPTSKAYGCSVKYAS